jgi:hypothetical protein
MIEEEVTPLPLAHIYKLFHNKKRGIANLVCITRFWNNLHQVRLKSKDWKSQKFNVLGPIKTSSTLPKIYIMNTNMEI